MHIVVEDGSVLSAGDALIHLMGMNPKTREQAEAALRSPELRAQIAELYEGIAAQRGELSESAPDVPPTIFRPEWVHLPE